MVYYYDCCRIVVGGNETVTGNVEVSIPVGKKVEHLGIKIEMIGQIELYFDKGNPQKFTTLVRELESAGTMGSTKVFSLLQLVFICNDCDL